MQPRWRRIFATLSETFWILALALIGLFAFLVALGALAPADAVGVTVVVVLLACAWIAHAVWQSRHAEGRDPRVVRARERRGF
jgi:protein-S-isoprenylcysteine O-methyltransferase Ste14